MLIAALAAGVTYDAAAAQAGVSERTVRRRLDDPEFCRQVNDARHEVVARAVAQLSAASTEAVEALRDRRGAISLRLPMGRKHLVRATSAAIGAPSILLFFTIDAECDARAHGGDGLLSLRTLV